MAYADEYQGFVPVVGGFSDPSITSSNRSSGFIPVVGGFSQPQYQSPQYDFYSSDSFIPKKSNYYPDYDFSAFPSQEPKDTSEVISPVPTTPIVSLDDVSDDGSDDDGDDTDTEGQDTNTGAENTTGAISSVADALGISSITDTLGFTEPDVNTYTEPDIFGSNPFSVEAAFTGAAQNAVLGFLGVPEPVTQAIGLAVGAIGVANHAQALNNAIELEAAMWGQPPGRTIDFFNAIPSYLGLAPAPITEEEVDAALGKAGAYFAEGPLFGEPHAAGVPNQKTQLEIELEQIDAEEEAEAEANAAAAAVGFDVDEVDIAAEMTSEATSVGAAAAAAAEAAAEADAEAAADVAAAEEAAAAMSNPPDEEAMDPGEEDSSGGPGPGDPGGGVGEDSEAVGDPDTDSGDDDGDDPGGADGPG